MNQVDGNWYEGERNALVGIFPTTYVEIIHSETVVTQEIVSLEEKENMSLQPPPPPPKKKKKKIK